MSVDIKRLRELEQKAAEAPWRHGGHIIITDSDGSWIADCDFFPNTKFITEMRNALPALLDELEALRARAEIRPLTYEEVEEHSKNEFAKPLWIEFAGHVMADDTWASNSRITGIYKIWFVRKDGG